MLQAGAFRHRIAFQTPTEVQDQVSGEATISWTGIAEVPAWAQFDSRAGREFFQADQVIAVDEHVITIRYQSGIKPDMRVRFGDRYFEIISSRDPNQGKEVLYVLCKERVL